MNGKDRHGCLLNLPSFNNNISRKNIVPKFKTFEKAYLLEMEPTHACADGVEHQVESRDPVKKQ